MSQRSDEQLVTLILNGHPESFQILVERYQKQVFSLAYRLCGDYDEAQDLAQESFIRIYQELPRFDVSRRFFPWLYRVAHNVCVNQLQRRPRDLSSLDDSFDLSDEADPGDRPEQAYARVEQAATVQEAIASLPETYRLPLVLKYLRNMSYQEIADQMELPVSTIETRLFRGRNLLRKALESYMSNQD
ncbi:MAG: sigma-70 family RNA polymerase sigma factor [Firmicutes bacterium]|nr:sigma-70 family RNA polymerase sigma factor [Bacillota bacterium]